MALKSKLAFATGKSRTAAGKVLAAFMGDHRDMAALQMRVAVECDLHNGMIPLTRDEGAKGVTYKMAKAEKVKPTKVEELSTEELEAELVKRRQASSGRVIEA